MKAKRLVALVLVLVLALAVFAMPALAAYDVKPCPTCGRSSNVGLYYHASSWTTYGNNSCGHGGTGPDLLQRGTCTLRCFYDDTNFTSTERSVYCTNTGIRYD